MHSCFSWLGTGAWTTRDSVVKFLKQATITEMDPIEFAYGDMYYSTFLNQVPYQLENHLEELEDESTGFSKGASGKNRNKEHMVSYPWFLGLWIEILQRTRMFLNTIFFPFFFCQCSISLLKSCGMRWSGRMPSLSVRSYTQPISSVMSARPVTTIAACSFPTSTLSQMSGCSSTGPTLMFQ